MPDAFAATKCRSLPSVRHHCLALLAHSFKQHNRDSCSQVKASRPVHWDGDAIMNVGGEHVLRQPFRFPDQKPGSPFSETAPGDKDVGFLSSEKNSASPAAALAATLQTNPTIADALPASNPDLLGAILDRRAKSQAVSPGASLTPSRGKADQRCLCSAEFPARSRQR